MNGLSPAEDILWRRTKLGLLFDATQVTHLENFLQHDAIP